MKPYTRFASGLFAVLVLALAAPASAQLPPEIRQARAAGQVGEQADGYLGAVPGAQISATLRGMIDQINIQRRASYRALAQERSVSVNEAAAAVTCQVFETRIDIGERYRDEQGQWRQHTASAPVVMPSFCP